MAYGSTVVTGDDAIERERDTIILSKFKLAS